MVDALQLPERNGEVHLPTDEWRHLGHQRCVGSTLLPALAPDRASLEKGARWGLRSRRCRRGLLRRTIRRGRRGVPAQLRRARRLGASVAVTRRPARPSWTSGEACRPERQRPWERGHDLPDLSCTKGAIALCAHMLAAEGELDFDAPVASYWPEFAAAAGRVLVRHLLSHQAGLPAIRTPLAPGAFSTGSRWSRCSPPRSRSGARTAHGYHGLTFGFLVGELDPARQRHRRRGALPARRGRRAARHRPRDRPRRVASTAASRT